MSDETTAWVCPKCKRNNPFWRANCWGCDYIYLPTTVTERLISFWRWLGE